MRKTLLILLSLAAIIGLVTTACTVPATLVPATPTLAPATPTPTTAPPIKAPVKPVETLPEPSPTPFVPAALRVEASKALETFKQLVSAQNYKQMGFESLDEVAHITLGEPIQDFMVRLDHLQEYKEGSDPDEMLSATNLFVFPVLAKGQVRSSIEIVGEGSTWKTVSFGAPNSVKMLTSQLTIQSKVQKLPLYSFFIVRWTLDNAWQAICHHKSLFATLVELFGRLSSLATFRNCQIIRSSGPSPASAITRLS